jgi:ABC-type amino acid transport substrate-binding protein
MRRPARPRFSRDLTARLTALGAASLLLLLALMLGACGDSGDDSSTTASTAPGQTSVSLTAEEQDYLAEKGTLQVGAFKDYPPFGFVDDSGQPVGMSIDFWNLIADRLGVQVAFSPELFADQLDGLKEGRFDSLAGIFPLEERRQWFDFSGPYTVISTRIYVTTDNADKTTLDSLKGLKVAVVAGDSSEAIAKEAGLTTVPFDGYAEAVKSLDTGDAQALILDELVADYYINQFGLGGKVTSVGEPVDEGEMTLPVLKGDATLLAILNKGIDTVSVSEWQAIRSKWLGK